jgi:threonine/homoserine/homoserine lactone efflux protein
VMFSSADVLCVVLAHKVTAYFKSSGSANRIAQRFGGGVLIALGLNVALNRQ